jgi:GAG-pre-integrase domain
MIILYSLNFLPLFCTIKDRQSKTLLLQTHLSNGLYLLQLPYVIPSPQAHLGERAPTDLWHARFGHPTSTTTLHILHQFNLPCSLYKLTLCNECCVAKSHKSPFNSSSTLSHAPLKFVHSDL